MDAMVTLSATSTWIRKTTHDLEPLGGLQQLVQPERQERPEQGF